MPRDLAPEEPLEQTQAELLIQLAADSDMFHTPDGRLYATVTVNGHRETWPLNSRKFRQWLARRFWGLQGKPPSEQGLQGALGVLQGQADFDGAERRVFTRLGQDDDGTIYLDLGRSGWEAIKIDRSGWEIVQDPPVRFRRPNGMAALPIPEPGGSLNLLRPLVNLPDDEQWTLFCAWLVAACCPRGPYPILVVEGEQGSAKSWLARIVRLVLDPCTATIRSAPRDERNLMIAAMNNLILAYDNLSSIPEWLSDAFCRLSTGGGMSVRGLYTDDDEIIFDAQRPLVLTGITSLVERDDLRDRALILKLPRISEAGRRDEATVEAELTAVLPRVLGGLLDVVSQAMGRVDGIHLARSPRMADFARLATAAEPALGLSPGDFLAIYDTSRADAIEESIGLHPVAMAVRDFAPEAAGAVGAWRGTASQLLATLTDRVGDGVSKAKGWPRTAQHLSGDLTRIAPGLRQTGVLVERDRAGHRRTRNILIWRTRADAGGRSADGEDVLERPGHNGVPGDDLVTPARPADAADAGLLPLATVTEEDLDEERLAIRAEGATVTRGLAA